MTILTPSRTAFISFGTRQAWQERVVLPVQLVTYGLLIMIFAAIFQITPFEELPGTITLSAPMMIWYMIVTEMVTFAGGGQNFHDIRSDVLGGQFSASLQRPKTYFLTKMWTWVGTNIVRSAAFMTAGLALGLLFTKDFLYSPAQIPFLLLSVYLGTLIYSAVYFMLGVIEVWGPYARPAMWISQKLAFLLGGLILPLQLYPEWLQSIAWLTPYPAMLNIPGKIAFDPSITDMAAALGIQLLWLAIIIACGFWMQARAYETILKRGQ